LGACALRRTDRCGISPSDPLGPIWLESGTVGKTGCDPVSQRSRARSHRVSRVLSTPSGTVGQLGHPGLGQTGRCPFHHPRAASSHGVGAEVLAAGGDCVDAVIATTFALGALEPWMSGVGGGGAMVLYREREDRYEGDRLRNASARQSSSRRLRADGRRPGLRHLLLAAGEGRPQSAWSGSIAAPGVVAGMVTRRSSKEAISVIRALRDAKSSFRRLQW
jgi:gamma-glutamyltranspeptidase